jgi:hypothetical protein
MDQSVRRYTFGKRQMSVPCYNKNPYGLPRENWNEALKSEFDTYQKWRTQGFNLDRPKHLKQRKTTFKSSIFEFETYFGYLANVRKLPEEELRLHHIAELDLVRAYVEWHAETRADGNASRYTQMTLGNFVTIAHYYLKVPIEQWMALNQLRQAVSPETKRDKRLLRNSLSTLEQIGMAERPAVAALSQATTDHAKRVLATRAQRSLIIRLLVRRPLRSRNMREMKLDRNLIKEDGCWVLEFQGEELKVGRLRGRQNVYRILFPKDLVEQLDEFLQTWRPLLPGHARNELFTTLTGRAFATDSLNTEIKKAVYAYTKRPTNIHLFRDIWVSEFLIETQDFISAAEVLGDRIETVLARYADLRRIDAGDVADRFMEEKIKPKHLTT